VSAGKTEVDVKDGIVTLRGEATSQAQKDLTTEYAKEKAEEEYKGFMGRYGKPPSGEKIK
jgi:hypothetical protein